MNRKTLFLIAALGSALGMSAAPLTPEQAISRARSVSQLRVMSQNNVVEKPVLSVMTEAGSPAAYVFSRPGAGFTIVSGDDIAYPVLGYSDAETFDVNNIPPQMQWWLDEYARQIEWASRNGVSPSVAPLTYENRKAIAPLVTSKWNQDKPYNNECPKKDGKLCVTGCVATSMAQVMNYFKYPEVGEGIKQYTCGSLNRKMTINFAQREFDWENMLDSYTGNSYNETQASAVAYLMKACGYSVEMGYGVNVSGTAGANIAGALRTYFKYDDATRAYQRDCYSSEEWDEMIYSNLNEIGPLVINGQSPREGGHSFVCDGYDGKGYYHINWGWGGISDGYYLLDALNPSSQGIGGYNGGFNFGQNAILGIQPDTGKAFDLPAETVFLNGVLHAEVSGSNMTFSLTDYDPAGWGCPYIFDRINVLLGASFRNVDGGEEIVSKSQFTADLTPGSYYPGDRLLPVVAIPSLPNGKYKVTIVCQKSGGEGPWTPAWCLRGYSNYVILNVVDGRYTVESVAPLSISFSDLQAITKLYSGKSIQFSVDAANNTDMQLSQSISPVLCNAQGEAVFFGESNLISLDAGAKENKVFITRFMNANGGLASVSTATDYILKLQNPASEEYYDGISIPVQLLPNPGSGTLMLQSFSIENSETMHMTIGDREMDKVYKVENPADFNVLVSFKVNRGYFDGVVRASIETVTADEPYVYHTLIDDIYSEWEFLERNTVKELNIPVDFASADKNSLYFVTVSASRTGASSKIAAVPFMWYDASGVDDVVSDDSQTPEEYFSLQGVKISEPAPGQIVIVRKGSRTFKTVVK